MRAMVLEKAKSPLVLQQVPIPAPGSNQVLIRVLCCGVCRTDLHIVDGEIETQLPIIPGHQIVGVVEAKGENAPVLVGTLVGVPWLGGTCGTCFYCRNEKENLCNAPLFTGCMLNGGFAEYCIARADYVFPLPDTHPPEEMAPWLCAGLIGYRTYRKAADAKSIGIYGFGAAAHLITQLAVWEGKEVFAFTKQGDDAGQSFARSHGAAWAGSSLEAPPESLDAALIFAPVGALVPLALKAVRKGGKVVCGGIYMSDIPSFPYNLLWGERSIESVANLTRRDAMEFLDLAQHVPIHCTTTLYPLENTNDALADLRSGQMKGSAVVQVARNRQI